MTKQSRTIEAQYDLASAAVEGGATRKSATTLEWDVAGKCEAPKIVEMIGRPSAPLIVVGRAISQSSRVEVGPLKPIPIFVDLTVACRKCRSCLKHRANYWRTRAKSEVQVSVRTWFITLTLRPDRTFYYLESMRHRKHLSGIDADAENSDVRFRWLCQEIGRELTLFLKRVRKNSRAKFRHLFVFERHKSGDPHIHGFIHEVVRDNPVSKRIIQAAWHDGFSNCKLVNLADAGKSAHYATKYVAKEAATRIRASKRYGKGQNNLSAMLQATVELNRRIDVRRNVGLTVSDHNPKSQDVGCEMYDQRNGTPSSFLHDGGSDQ